MLFDEIEKAHPDVFNVMLQILDDGQLTDGQGRKVDFKNTVIIMTSNVGASQISSRRPLGFNDSGDDYEKTQEKIRSDVMDDIIVFRQLTKEDIREIAQRLSSSVVSRLENLGIHLLLTDSAIDVLAEKGFDASYGARPLKRAIQTLIEDVAAEKILDGTFGKGDSVEVSGLDGEILFRKQDEKEVPENKE